METTYPITTAVVIMLIRCGRILLRKMQQPVRSNYRLECPYFDSDGSIDMRKFAAESTLKQEVFVEELKHVGVVEKHRNGEYYKTVFVYTSDQFEEFDPDNPEFEWLDLSQQSPNSLDSFSRFIIEGYKSGKLPEVFDATQKYAMGS